MTITIYHYNIMTNIQSLRFSKDKFPTSQSVRNWIRKSSFKSMKEPEEGTTEWKVRIEFPERFRRFARKVIDEGVNAVIGFK
jgi:hypothetical protein